MDRYSGRRRSAWQTNAAFWPFALLAFVAVFIICLGISPIAGGMILGDGTAGGRAIVWFKMLSNVLVPALVVGLLAGFMLHQFFLAPAGRHGAMTWRRCWS